MHIISDESTFATYRHTSWCRMAVGVEDKISTVLTSEDVCVPITSLLFLSESTVKA